MAKETNNDNGQDLKRKNKIETFEEIEELGPESIAEIDSGFKNELERWFVQNNVENLDPIIQVYRVFGFNNKQKAICGYFTDHIPTDHEIGMNYGSGRYMIFVHIPQGKKQKGRTSTRTINVDTIYDQLRKKESQLTTPATAPAIIPSGSAPMSELLQLFKEFMVVLSPLLMQRNTISPGAEMIQSYAAMNQVLKAQAHENLSLFTDYQRKALNLPTPEPSEIVSAEETEKGLMDKIFELFNSPVVASIIQSLTKDNTQAQIAAQTVRAIPEVKKIIVDPAQLKATVNFLDKKLGPTKTNIVLKNLKVKRPMGTGFKHLSPLVNPPHRTKTCINENIPCQLRGGSNGKGGLKCYSRGSIDKCYQKNENKKNIIDEVMSQTRNKK
jgi:hypothetical protein